MTLPTIYPFLRMLWKRMLRGNATRSANVLHQTRVIPTVEILEARVVLDGQSAGANGIRAVGIDVDDVELTGQDIHIGQVEAGRPGKAGVDNGNPQDPERPLLVHPNVLPAGVYYQNGPPRRNQNVSFQEFHATKVASVMNAWSNNEGFTNLGVAPEASLYSSASNAETAIPGPQDMANTILSMQHVASFNFDDVVAVNMSFGWPTRGNPQSLSGSSLASLGMDYLTKKNETLFVQGVGNQRFDRQGRPQETGMIPADSYNALVVGAARGDGIFRQVSLKTDLTRGVGSRVLINLIAPGEGVNVATIEGNVPRFTVGEGGTSIAAPHATGAVALLHQAARAVLDSESPVLAKIKERPELMKAILINAADKISDEVSGSDLNVDRTIVKLDNRSTWLDSAARDEPSMDPELTEEDNDEITEVRMAAPLDEQMGAGFLDVERAVEQLGSGISGQLDQENGAIGWDLRE